MRLTDAKAMDEQVLSELPNAQEKYGGLEIFVTTVLAPSASNDDIQEIVNEYRLPPLPFPIELDDLADSLYWLVITPMSKKSTLMQVGAGAYGVKLNASDAISIVFISEKEELAELYKLAERKAKRD